MAIKISSNTIFGTTSSVFNSATVVGGVVTGPKYKFQGEVSGYTSGGVVGGSPGLSNVIDKFPFSADFETATDVGYLTLARNGAAGQSSFTHGYTSGGATPSYTTVIDKFPFYADADATDVGNLTQSRRYVAGQSSAEYGYTSGGYTLSSWKSTIDKFLFASDFLTVDVGDLTEQRQGLTGQSSETHGYASGGTAPQINPPFYLNTIDKFPFSADFTTATDVGDLTQKRYQAAGQSSTESGYTSGGAGTSTKIIDKFPFATDADATYVGDLTVEKSSPTGQSSTTDGYNSGGMLSGAVKTDAIEKFPFSVDADAAYVGDLSQARSYAAGQQY